MSEPTIVTVRGPIPAGQLGVTLMHEHIFINLVREFRGDGLLNDPPLAARELIRFREAGGATVVDVTNASLGRHPQTLQAISEQVGVNIVLGAGLYRHQYFDAAWVDRTSTDAMAAWIVHDLTVGIAGTGIRAGIIGEIACDEWITAQEERVFRAAARAHKKTGVTITTHAARWPIGLAQLDLLAEEGVDLRRVVVGHCDTVNAAGWTSPIPHPPPWESVKGCFLPSWSIVPPEPALPNVLPSMTHMSMPSMRSTWGTLSSYPLGARSVNKLWRSVMCESASTIRTSSASFTIVVSSSRRPQFATP